MNLQEQIKRILKEEVNNFSKEKTISDFELEQKHLEQLKKQSLKNDTQTNKITYEILCWELEHTAKGKPSAKCSNQHEHRH